MFDLDLPATFEPSPGDGEVESFSLAEVEGRLMSEMETDPENSEWKPNCRLVVIDWLLRRGRLGPGSLSCHEEDLALQVQLCLVSSPLFFFSPNRATGPHPPPLQTRSRTSRISLLNCERPQDFTRASSWIVLLQGGTRDDGGFLDKTILVPVLRV